MKASVTLGRIAGIEIGVHYSWVLAFALVAVTLAVGFFPTVYPDWFVATYWVTGIVTAILLFVSVLVHEMSHLLVARARGLPVHGITLFIFGGVSNLRGEAKEARDEFLITIVGPLTSALLGGAFWGLSFLVPDQQSPVAAILFYLGIINVILAAFNLLPGFPLDGGRVLRSILWGTTGSLRKASQYRGRRQP